MTPAILDDPAAIARADAHGVRDVLAGFPAQCRAAAALAVTPAPVGPRPRVVIIAGMGGSASGGDLLATCVAEHLDVPVLIHRGYGLPGVAGPEDLVIASSYSGDTAETLSAAETALTRKSSVVAVTAGGRLAVLAQEHRWPRVTLPGGLMPRMALGYLFFSLVAVFREVGLDAASRADVDEALAVVDAQARVLGPGTRGDGNEAKRLAHAIGDRLPVVYGGPLTGSVAYRWKTDLEENAKTLAIAGAVPEMNHNEVEAWRTPDARGRHLMFLRDAGESAEIRRRFTILRDLIGGAAGGVVDVETRGAGRLARVLSLAYLGQWVSFYVALLRGVDPWSIPVLDELKARMRSAPAP